MRPTWVLLVVLAAVCVSATTGTAQQGKKPVTRATPAKRAPAGDDVLRALVYVQEFAQSAISPDGKRVASDRNARCLLSGDHARSCSSNFAEPARPVTRTGLPFVRYSET